MSFIENQLSELSGTVTVTPARPRRRAASVRQRIAVIEALERSVGPERAERIGRAVASSGARDLSLTDRSAYLAAENAIEGEDATVSQVDDSGSERFATPNDSLRLMATGATSLCRRPGGCQACLAARQASSGGLPTRLPPSASPG